MPYTQRYLSGYSMSDSSNGIIVRSVEPYAVVGRVAPVTVRYQGINALVPDNKAFRLRSQRAFIIAKAPAQGQVRQSVVYAVRKNPPMGQVRQMVSYAVILKPQSVVRDKTGLAAFYDMLNANNKQADSITLSASNLGVGVPYAASKDDKNTGVTVTAIGHYGYSGHAEIYYNRIQIARLFLATDMKITVPAATTISALIPQINTAYATNLVAGDVVDGPVPANASGIRLTAASTSIMWNPGTYVALGVDPGPFS
jgi:hypothetical protein